MNGNLFRIIRLFCERNGVAESRFGRLAVNDPALVSDMRSGRTLRPRTARRIREYMGVAL